MKSFIASLVALAVIGFGAYSILDSQFQQSADKAFTTTSVRIDPGKH